MNAFQISKLLALLAAVLTGGSTILAGDIATGSGILAAAWSSGSALRKEVKG